MKEQQIKRSLYYYDLIWKIFDEDRGEFKNVRNKKTKFENFLNKFNFKKGERLNGKYIILTERGDSVFVITDNIDDDYIEFRIVLSKNNALPLVETGGNLKELEEFIGEKQNIAEITHCVFFKKTGILGGEFNFSGARVSVLNWYMPRVLAKDGDDKNLYEVKFVSKINNDAYKKLDHNKGLTLFDMSFKPDSDVYREVLAEKSIFWGAVQSVPDAEVIEITVKKRKKNKKDYQRMSSVLTGKEIQRILKEFRDDVGRFYVSQETYSDGVDLLNDKLVTTIDIIRTKKRTIDSQDIYQKIKNFYREEIE